MTDYLLNVIGHHTDSYHKVIRMLCSWFCQAGEPTFMPPAGIWHYWKINLTPAAKVCIYIHKEPFK